MKLKINDTIKVLSGDDTGRTGKISKVFIGENKVLVEGINTYKKHIKAQNNQEGGIVTLSRPISSSKVQLVCPHCKKATRVKYSGTKKDKVRVCKKCDKPITTTKSKK